MNIYQIKIALKHSTPPIWRRIQVPADIKLGKLHRILQAVMGWTDSHLHAFRVGRTTYGVPDRESPDDIQNERNIPLDSIAAAGDAIVYEYDFGDGWDHQLKIEKSLTAEPDARYPRCLAGERACPPEDCGGPPGYERMLEILRDPKHEEYQDTRQWLGDDFDPEAFDLADINDALTATR